MQTQCYAFDIETAPLPDGELEKQLKPFDPDSVKVGNLTDPAKIQSKIEEARRDYRQNFAKRAALGCRTAQILAVGWQRIITPNQGYRGETEQPEHRGIFHIEEDGEASMLRRFWELWVEMPRRWYGHNIEWFDLPVLEMRSYHYDIPVPKSAKRINGRYYDSKFVYDTAAHAPRTSYAEHVSLNSLAISLGLPGKTGNGADFAAKYKEDRKAALEYLTHDVWLTAEVAKRMQATW